MITDLSLAVLDYFVGLPRRAVLGLCDAGLTVVLLLAMIVVASFQMLGAGVAQSRVYRWIFE